MLVILPTFRNKIIRKNKLDHIKHFHNKSTVIQEEADKKQK